MKIESDTLSKELHELNRYAGSAVISADICAFTKDVHLQKQKDPNDVTDAGTTTDVNAVQP